MSRLDMGAKLAANRQLPGVQVRPSVPIRPGVKKRLIVSAVLICSAATPSVGQGGVATQTFIAWGYGCIVNGVASLHDAVEPPTCSRPGLQLGAVSFGTIPTEQVEVFDSDTRPIDGSAPRTKQPIEVLIRKQGAGYTKFTVRPTVSRAQRHAINMSTIELDMWTWKPTRPTLSRDAVFGLLPTLATIAPNATIRTARTITQTGFVYGAQIRDPRLTSRQRSKLLTRAKQRGIPLRFITQPADLLGGTCPGIPSAVQLPTVERLDLSADVVVDANAFTTTLACDAISQVQVLQQSVVGTPPVQPTTDLVVDASLRFVKMP
jgi:hypothetical protein